MSEPSLNVDDIVAGSVTPAATKPVYVLAMLGAMTALLTMIAAYIALIVAVGFGVWWWIATWMVPAMAKGDLSRNNSYFRMLFLLLPVIVGCIVIVSMLKPFFARRRGRDYAIELERDAAPQLHALVGAIASKMGATIPSRILLEVPPNAAAALKGIASRELELRLGLPLLLRLDVREISAVIAHELGHFRQGAGIRLGLAVRATTQYLWAAVYGRDAWDQSLVQASKPGLPGNMIIGGTGRAAVWAARRVLWALAMLGFAAAAPLSRQMEFDADDVAAQVAGRKSFATVLDKLARLQVALQFAEQQLAECMQRRELLGDIPHVVAAIDGQFEADLIRRIREHATSASRSRFDSHPTFTERIVAIGQHSDDGLIRIDAPASALVPNVADLCQAVTASLYRVQFGINLEPVPPPPPLPPLGPEPLP